jgi:hypothetical protein
LISEPSAEELGQPPSSPTPPAEELGQLLSSPAPVLLHDDHNHTKVFSVNDLRASPEFYHDRLNELNVDTLRKIIPCWALLLSGTRNMRSHGRSCSIWWPASCPYVQATRLKRSSQSVPEATLSFLVPSLFVDLLLLTADLTDKPKRISGQGPWIDRLQGEAFRTLQDAKVSSEPSKNKNRNLEPWVKVLPILFYIATAHEMYMTRHNLLEGSGGTDPLTAECFGWERSPKDFEEQ